jgi:hypothetical protein
MQHTLSKFLASSTILLSLLFTGCGETGSTPSIKQPTNTTKVVRVDADETDWTWFVGTDGTHGDADLTFDVYFSKDIPAEVQHFQYFLDTDNNSATGFSFGEDSWRISGADYLVEDGELYKSNSNDAWSWTYVGSFDDYVKTAANGEAHIHISTDNPSIAAIVTADTVNITIEPFDANWGSTYSTISTQAVPMGAVVPPVVHKTIFEDFENGFDAWQLVQDGGVASRKPEMRMISPGFNHTHTARFQPTGSSSQNIYQRAMYSDTQTILEVEVGGIQGDNMPHFLIGVYVQTTQGRRIMTWDSYYNHVNEGPHKRIDGNNVNLSYPSPIEHVRGYGYAPQDQVETFRVDLNQQLKILEPNNEIISVSTLIVGGGHLDNISLSDR